ncbi:MAG: TolC family protein [bacterium]|nr:TolC family protein [bacterium]
MKYLVYIICCLSLFSQGIMAKKNYSLDQLLQLARQNNLVMKVSQLDKKIAVEEYKNERALSNPEFEYAQGKFKITGESEQHSISGMGLKWSMPNPLHRLYSLKSLRKSIGSADIEGIIQNQEIISNVKAHYFKLRLANKVKSFLKEKLRILEALNKITKVKVSIGESMSIDALRSSVEIQKIKTLIFKCFKNIAHERTALNELLNFTLPDDFSVTGTVPFTPLADVESKVRSLIEKSPHVRLRLNRLQQEKANHKAAGLSFIDEVELFGEQETEVEGKKWKVGIGVSIPLFNQNAALTRKARFQKEKARIEYEHAKKHFYADILRMLSDIRVLEKEIDTFKGAVLKEGKTNLELSEQLFKAGEVPLVVFLDSQNSYFEMQERYFEAITEWHILKAELEALLGEEL